MANSRISVRLDKATQQRLEQAVKTTGESESELVRAALANYLQQWPETEKCLELARQNGLVGCAKRLPSDLSANRKHLEGFGR